MRARCNFRTWTWTLALVGVGLIGPVGSPAAVASDFTKGDFYIHTFDWPGVGSALARIDPITGDAAVIYTHAAGLRAHMTYDPWRDRIILMPDTNSNVFELVDAQGNMTPWPNPWAPPSTVAAWAPTGDGRLYMVTVGLGYFGHIDAEGQGHALLDTDGVTPFFFTYGATLREDLIYDTGTNSLFLSHFGAATEVTRIPLSADGTKLAAPAETVCFDAFGPTADEPMGLGAGPNGTLFIKIDTNSSADGLRMFTVDPVTLAFAPYAYIGHPFAGGNTAGIYNSTYDFAIAMDSFNDVIRAYVESPQVQEGTIFTMDVSGNGGSGEQTRIITIGDTINGYVAPVCATDFNGDGCINVSDLLGMLGAWGSSNPLYDVAPAGGDGIVDVQDLLAMLGDSTLR